MLALRPSVCRYKSISKHITKKTFSYKWLLALINLLDFIGVLTNKLIPNILLVSVTDILVSQIFILFLSLMAVARWGGDEVGID